ncbi:hypothetical protein [Chromobacterium aquaticum]|uniref:Uncharacterized protein n=1 Tax=Chromobacterium aquaticum TaxID=467180 RepID=A0ABV8ZV19_9NEIS|nr:hypothetical protein [Chromobacterium aquaticum]MCD5364126.1 hypothetical protein [Chromobacterium aquaticum]
MASGLSERVLEKLENKIELERVRLKIGVDSMPANPWEFDVDLGGDSVNAMERLLSIVRAIAESSVGSWPSDDEWKAMLPDWLKHEVPELSKEQTDKLLSVTSPQDWGSLPWEFFSWLDAIRDRGWRWWGYQQKGATATIVLHIAMFPERIDAFRELLRAVGMHITDERYTALA